MNEAQTEEAQIHIFDDIEQVVSDSLRFKRKLAIGGDAYTSFRIGKTLQQIWDVGGVAATGGGLASSSLVAGSFFSGSWLSAIGLGAAAATPIGWVIGAAVASGGAYYGVTRLFKGYGQSRVETIPKFINTPIDLLGASLMDLLGAFALKIAAIDGTIDKREANFIKQYFVFEWGYDAGYVASAFQVLEENSERSKIVVMTKTFADYTKSNPDCNFDAIRKELISLLTAIAEADGRIDEREELAIDKISQILKQEASMITSVGDTASVARGAAASAVGEVAAVPAKAGNWLSKKIFSKDT